MTQRQRDLVACLKRLQYTAVPKVVRDEEFMDFHRNRNVYFNDYSVTTLTELPPYSLTAPRYKDQMNRIWTEVLIGVKYHVPKGKWGENMRKLGAFRKNRFSRKFLMNDPLGGFVGPASEMIVKKNGNRIWNGELMETYNFGVSTARSSFGGVSIFGKQAINAGAHYRFDMAPHDFDGYTKYKTKEPASSVRIYDLPDLIDMGKVKIEDII